MLVPDSKYFEHPIVNPRFLKKNYPNFYEYLIHQYPQVKSIAEALYLWKHGLKNPPVCASCGSPVKFYGINSGFATYCSYKCSNKNSVSKSKQTKTVRYGDPNFNNRSKAAETCLNEYGVDNPSKSEKVKEQIRKTCKDKYGKEYSAQVPEFIEKKNVTFRSNHPGFESPLQLEKTKINRDQTRKENALNKHRDIIDIDIDRKLYICRCPHEECTKCSEKKYEIKPSAYFDRKRNGTEPCTNILPFDENHNQGTSIEIFIRDLLDKYNIHFETNNKQILNRRELDIYIPSKNIAIECNGIYWHSIKSNQYHFEKWKNCKEKNIQLLSIWEDWIVCKPDIVKSIILSKLGIYDKRIGARRCEIKEISSKVCNDFLLVNHIQGPTKSNVHIGLYYKGHLVSVMTFGKKRAGMGSRIKENGEYELSRFCTKLNTQVVGGAAKMVKYFIENYNPKSIYSFSSNDISSGELYRKLGFKESGTNQSYWYVYVKGFQRYHRLSFTKDDIVRKGWKPNKIGWTEKEVMFEHGYIQIYDSGQIKWVLKINT